MTHHRSNTPWPPNEVETLKKRWAEGKSGSEIARELGTKSRSAVCGMARRLNLKKRGEPANFATCNVTVKASRKAKAPEVKRDRWPGAANARGNRPPKPGPQFKPGAIFGNVQTVSPEVAEARKTKSGLSGQARVAAFIEPANDTAVTLIERRFGQCSWPVGEPERPADQLCCGAPMMPDANRAAPTYCARHCAMALTPRADTAPRSAAAYEKSLRRYVG